MKSNINYTPLAQTVNKSGDNNSPIKHFFYNAGAIVSAVFVLLAFITFKNINTPKTISSKASEIVQKPCNFNLDINPKKLTAFIMQGGQKKQINIGDTIQPKSKITFEWEAVPTVTDYFIALGTISPSSASGRLDPVLKGINTQKNSFVFDSLTPQTHYYLFIRSNSPKGIGIAYPTPGNCKDTLPAMPIFEFITSS